MWHYYHQNDVYLYVVVLDDIVAPHNDTVDRSMRITPNHVNEYNIATVWETLYGDGNMSPHQPDKNEVSDYVRILLTRVHVRIGYGAI